MQHGSNDQLVQTLIRSVRLHTEITEALAFRAYPAGGAIGAGAVWHGQMYTTAELTFFARENWRTVESCVAEIHRRFELTPDEIDAEAAGLTLAELARAKQMHAV